MKANCRTLGRSLFCICTLSLTSCGHIVAINTGVTAVALGADTLGKVIESATQLIEFGELIKHKVRENDDAPVISKDK